MTPPVKSPGRLAVSRGRLAMRAGPALLGLCLLACLSPLPPLPPAAQLGPSPGAIEQATSLRASIAAVAGARGNLARQRAIRARADALGLTPQTRTEWIDWFSLQRNVVIEIPGASDRIVYVVAHTDKTDLHPLKLVSLLLNGLLDDLLAPLALSEGAVDNATGVAVALELAHALVAEPSAHTVRILLAGAEEAGLRGSRAHVARLPAEEKAAIALAINLDSVGVSYTGNCVTANLSDAEALDRALEAAQTLDLELGVSRIPSGYLTDAVVFRSTSFWRDLGRGLMVNLVGGFLPQRSWFTGSHSAPTLNFSACELIDWSDRIGSSVLLPLGRIHGPRDRASRVDVRRLYEQYVIVDTVVRALPSEAAPPAP